jgi:hypothetical protein
MRYPGEPKVGKSSNLSVRNLSLVYTIVLFTRRAVYIGKDILTPLLEGKNSIFRGKWEEQGFQNKKRHRLLGASRSIFNNVFLYHTCFLMCQSLVQPPALL